jgi:hypothetical protein
MRGAPAETSRLIFEGEASLHRVAVRLRRDPDGEHRRGSSQGERRGRRPSTQRHERKVRATAER